MKTEKNKTYEEQIEALQAENIADEKAYVKYEKEFTKWKDAQFKGRESTKVFSGLTVSWEEDGVPQQIGPDRDMTWQEFRRALQNAGIVVAGHIRRRREEAGQESRPMESPREVARRMVKARAARDAEIFELTQRIKKRPKV